MKAALIGASGFIGSVILKELLARGHEVTAIVRNAGKITAQSPNLRIVEQDAGDQKALAAVLKGHDAVISSYNPGWSNPNIVEDTKRVNPAILEAVKEAAIPRFQVVGGAGTLFCAPGVRVLDAGVIPEDLLPAIRAFGEFFLNTLAKENNVDWIFFSPAGTIEPGERTGKYRLGHDDLIVDADGKSRISVEDYAKAMVDELEKPIHHKERFTIGY